MHSTSCMQLNPCRLFGSITRLNNGTLVAQSETFHGETRTAREPEDPQPYAVWTANQIPEEEPTNVED